MKELAYMKISATTSYNKKIYNTNTSSKNKDISFGSLTKFMETNVWAMPYQKAQQLIASYTKPSLVVGHFPKDILEILMKNSQNSGELTAKIQMFNNSLGELAEKIRGFDKNVFDKINKYSPIEFAYTSIKKMSSKTYDRNNIGFVQLPFKMFMDNQDMEKILNDGIFENAMKKIGLIPEDGSAKFKFIGTGVFKNCFKMMFKDSYGDYLFHPKAFVIGKTNECIGQYNSVMENKINNYIKNISFEDFEKAIIEKMNEEYPQGSKYREEIINCIKPYYDSTYKTTRIYDCGQIMDEFHDVNGLFPEANAALTIRKHLGKNMKTSNIIEPYIFDLKKQFGLLEFSDNALPAIKHKYDFKKYGLDWSDNRDCNTINRIIDFGCIYPDTPDNRIRFDFM